MTVSSVNNTPTILPKGTATGFGAMGASDFIKLMTAQLTQQDPTDPVDNKDMLAQMAQFSSLSTASESSVTLKDIAKKLDAILAAQTAGSGLAPSSSANSTPTTAETGAQTSTQEN